MVYIKTWTDFETAVVDLYLRAPRTARYVVHFEPKTGKLVLKVTDDSKCIQYKTHSAIILNRFEALTQRLLSTIANARRRPTVPILSGSGTATPAAEGVDDPMSGGGSGTATPQPQAAPKAAGGKKKKKKGKK